MRLRYLLLSALFMTGCEEAVAISTVGVVSAISGYGGFTAAVKIQESDCKAKPSKDERCQCYATHFNGILPTPQECWVRK